MRVLLSSNPYRDRGLRVALEARRILNNAGAETALCLPFAPRKGDRLDLPRPGEAGQHGGGAEAGGCAALLRRRRDHPPRGRDATLHDVPILGVNMGSVGFMAELERGELSLLTLLAAGEYRTEERMMLSVRVLRGEKVLSEDLALNDAVISKGSMARVAEMEVRADGVLVTNLMGDGVIVSTPTGSTAYSMSAGGPIVEPTSRDIIVTPVCAHQLSTRSMVLAPERLVTVQLPRGSRKHLYLAVDGGKALRITGTERVEISCARQSTRLIRLTERNFYQIIYQKLGGYEL